MRTAFCASGVAVFSPWKRRLLSSSHPTVPTLRHILPALLFLFAGVSRAANFYVAPGGSDAAAGSEAAPFATIMRAQTAASAGDTVWLRGGTYLLDNTHITRTDTNYAYVNDFTKSGVRYFGYPGETPVFDFTAVKPSAKRVTAFLLRTTNLHLRDFHVVGVQVTITAGGTVTNTQSENIRITGGSNNTLERLVLRDGMGIGVYITGSSANNLILNCDAYNNCGLDSLSIGNVDGFGSHTTASGVGNIFRGCRAWLNSDDGFDFINCHAAATIDSCWAFFSGYKNASLASGGDGNGFKAGGYGRNGSTLPNPVPRHVVRRSLAVANRASGFYANHHPGGLDFVGNTAFRNSTNFNMLNVASDNLTDVPGYGHFLKNNLGYSPRSTSLSNIDQAACDVTYNFFTLPVTVSAADFVATPTATASLLAYVSAPRQADGSLPAIDLLRLVNGSDVIDQGADVGMPYNLGAPDLGCFENGFIPAPSGLAALAANGRVTLSWSALPGTVTYTIARGATAAGPFTALGTVGGTTSYPDSSVVNGTTYHYIVSAANTFGASAASPSVSALPLSPFGAWVRGFFPGNDEAAVIGPDSDPDGDGVPNLVEYLLGASPALANATSPLSQETVSPDEVVLRYEALKDTTGIAAVLETSSDLATWVDSGLVPVIESDLGTRWRLRVSVQPGAAGRSFWRLRVTEP